MQKNEVAIVTIEDIGVNGEGIGKVDGYTLFIKDAVIGDVAEVKVMKAKKNYGYARLMQVITPSEYRVEPRCNFARKCGGCQIQEMSYEQQLAFKQKKVRDNLERIGGFSPELLDETMEPIVGMQEPFCYRNKAQFPFGTDKDGNPITGFYAGRTHDIIANTDCALGVPANREILEIILRFMRKYQIPSYDEKTGEGLIRHAHDIIANTDCALGVPANREILEIILRFMRKYQIPSYDEKTGEGLIRHALIRYGFTTKEIMVCLVINRAEEKMHAQKEWIPHQNELVEMLTAIKGMTSITVSPNLVRKRKCMRRRNGFHIRMSWWKC